MTKRNIIIGLIVLAVLAAGGGYLAYKRYATPVATAQEATLKTDTVQRGDLTITADGTGNLLPASKVALAFQVNGIVTEVNVQVSDRVNKGDVLAKLDTTELYNTVRQATYQLEQARYTLQKAQRDADSGTTAEIAKKSLEAARLALVNAQGSYASTLLSADVSSAVREAKAWADFWQSDVGDKWLRLEKSPNNEQRRLEYEVAGAKAEAATNNWKQLEQNAQNQKVAGWRNIVQAQQSYLSALSSYSDTLSGDTLREAELTVLQNEIKLTQAQTDLKNAALTAPFTGTVTAVTIVAGQSAGSTSITLIDLEHPQVRFWVEEADLAKVVVGNKVNVTFEALPDNTFTGKIVRVEPELTTVGSTTAVQAWATLDDTSNVTLLSGMTAEVEVVAAEALNVLLVPVQALREISTGNYVVFVVKDDKSLEMRQVTVGLKDLVNAEILSGLQEGETVSLGTKSTTQSNSSSRQNTGGPMDGGFMVPLGGMP